MCHRWCARIVLARFRRRVAVRVVSELAEHSGAEHHTQAREALIDPGVGMFVQMLGDLGLERTELIVHR